LLTRATAATTAQADSLWFSSDSSPSQADKVLIRTLEVEGHLLPRQPGCGGAAAASVLLPPLDVARDISCLADVPTAFLCPISMRCAEVFSLASSATLSST
jgi:hypothetical protein